MADVISLAEYRLQGSQAVRAFLAFELAAGVSVHTAAWTFAMPEPEYAASGLDAGRMGRLLSEAGLSYFPGSDERPAALLLRDEARFRAVFHSLGCRHAVLPALRGGISIRRSLEQCV